MYEDILKFLKSKNKKLTKEEASEFIRLLAESVGCDEEISIHSTLDNSDDELSTEINLVIDNLNMDSYSEDDSFSLDGLSDEEEEDKEYVVLNKRKIKRSKDFKRQRIDEVPDENNKINTENNKIKTENNKIKTENNKIKIENNKIKTESQNIEKSVVSKKENMEFRKKKDSLVNDIEKLQKKNEEKDTLSKKEDKFKEFVKKKNEEAFSIDNPVNEPSPIDIDNPVNDKDKKISFSLPKDFNISNCNFQVSENIEKTPFSLPESSDKPKFEFKLPQMNENKKFEFKLPKFDCQAQNENEEFKFDLGDLIDVNNNGPDYKFYDDENNEL